MNQEAPYNYDYRYLSEHRRHRYEQPNFEHETRNLKDLGKKTITVQPVRKRPKTKPKDNLFFYRFNIPDQIKKEHTNNYVKYRCGLRNPYYSFYQKNG